MVSTPSIISRFRIVAFVAAVLNLFSGCVDKIDDIRAIPNITEHPAMSASKVVLYHSQYGIVKLKVVASTVNVYNFQDEPKTEFPDGIVVEFFDDKMNVTSYLSANQAVYFEKQNRWEATGNVEAKNIEGTIFNTEFIEWDERQGDIKSNRFIKVTDKDAIIIGKGFKAKQDFTDWKILKPTGVFNVNQQEFVPDENTAAEPF
jgi:LPS export ABC transporter protein LptC